MIKVKYRCEEEYITDIKVMGHSKVADYGKDILCASVSSIVITTVNGLLSLDKEAIDYQDENGVTIKVKRFDEDYNKLLINMINLLEELSEQYPDNIKVRKED